MLLNAEDRLLHYRAGYGYLSDQVNSDQVVPAAGRGFTLKVGEGLAGWVVQNREAVLINDLHKDPRWVRAASGQDMEAAVSEAGAAQAVADAKMKGLTGALLYAKGTIESALISAFLPFTDSLSAMIRRIADLVGKFTTLPEPVQKAAIVFAALLAAVGPILLALPLLAGLFAALLSPIGFIGIAVAALAAAWVADFGGIQGKTKEAINAIMPMFDMVRAWVAERLPVAIAYFQGVWASAVQKIMTHKLSVI